ncbi:MAG: hypothetical protein ACREA9_21075 [Pyrinomonadaceae bacterium]
MVRIFKERAIKVEFSPDRFGGITGRPINRAHCRKFAAHIKEMTGRADSSVYFQSGADELADIIPPRRLSELSAGWSATCLIDPETYGNLLGWDAHLVDLWPQRPGVPAMNDSRYTVALEYIGQAKPRWVARFCGNWLSWRKSQRSAWSDCQDHKQARETQLTAGSASDEN